MNKSLSLKQIRTDGKTQQRPIDEDVLKRYIALMKEGFEFPPVSVVYDGKTYWLWDGFHRYHALRKLGKSNIAINVEDGTQRDAQWFSFSANGDHGFPRQPGTAKEIIIKILADEEWKKQTDEAIALWVGVTQSYVSRIKREQSPKTVHSTDSGQDKSTSDNRPKTGGRKPPSSPSSPEEQGSENPKMIDSVGEKVPENLVNVFSRRDEIKVLILNLNRMLKQVKEGVASNDPLYAFVKLNPLQVETNNVKRNLKFSIPYAVCRYCGGDGGSGGNCRSCDGLGFCNETRYRTTAEELKKK